MVYLLFVFLAVTIVSAGFSCNGQSWSHRLVGLRILDENAGKPASQIQTGLRDILHIVDFITVGLGFLWPLWDGKQQTFADKIVGTRVVFEQREN